MKSKPSNPNSDTNRGKGTPLSQTLPVGRTMRLRKTSSPAGQNADTPGLARAFANEPELISACLRGAERKPDAWARRILAVAQVAMDNHPTYADLHYHSARVAMAANDHEAAARLLADALRVNPDYADALILAARVALCRARPADAKAFLQRALDAGADYPDAHVLMGNVWREERNWSQARSSYERALELNASLAEAREALASLPAAAARGKTDELPA